MGPRMNPTRMMLCAGLIFAACDSPGGDGDPAVDTQGASDTNGDDTNVDDAKDDDDTNSATDGADDGCDAGGTSDPCADTGEDDPTADGDPTGGDECVDAMAGVALEVAVNYPGAEDPDYFSFSAIPCVAGEAPLDLECQTTPDRTEAISLVVSGMGQALPWASGDALLLSTSWDFDDEFRSRQTRIVVRSPDEALLLVASGDSDEPNAAMIAPLTTSLDDACSPGGGERDASYLGRMTYELDGSSLTLVGNDQGVLDAPTGAFEVLQQDSTVGPSKHTFVNLTFVMVPIDR